MSIGDANVTCAITVSQPGCTVSCTKFGTTGLGEWGAFGWSMAVDVGTISIDLAYPNGKIPPLVINNGETKQFTAAFTWKDKTDTLPVANLDGTVTAIVNGQTVSANFQIGAYSSEAGYFERPDTINFVMSQNDKMSEGFIVTVPDVKTTFDGPSFNFSGLAAIGEVDDKGHQIWNMVVSVAEKVILKLVMSAL